MALFESYLVVDWSAASVPRVGRDSLWTCLWSPDGVDLRNHPTRRGFEEWFVAMSPRPTGRLLAGFDFSIGYPAGFARSAGLVEGQCAPWAATWSALAGLVDDMPDNANRRFEAAAALNRAIDPGAGPFWGCPPAAARPELSRLKAPGFPHGALAEYRLTELVMRAGGHRVFSSWQLLGAGSVGSQSLTGIPVLHRLRDHPALGPRLEIWPFTTGLRIPELADRRDAIVLAEVWPGWVPLDPDRHPVRDAAQVLGLAAALAELDAGGCLASHFSPTVGPQARASIEAEEGWILGAEPAPGTA